MEAERGRDQGMVARTGLFERSDWFSFRSTGDSAAARVYLEVRLANVPRKNGWEMAEHAGDATTKYTQHFLWCAKWNADDVRDALQQFVVEHLAQKDGVLIVDETGFLKKGTTSAGLGWQYSGTAGRIKNVRSESFLHIVPK